MFISVLSRARISDKNSISNVTGGEHQFIEANTPHGEKKGLQSNHKFSKIDETSSMTEAFFVYDQI